MGKFTRIGEKLRDALPPAVWFWLRFQRAQLMRKLRRADQKQSPVALAKNPAGNLDVIVVDALVPMPDRDAGSARMALILKALTELGKPAIISLSNLKLPEYEENLRQGGIEVASWVDYRRVLTSRHFQVAILSRSNVASALLPSLKRIAPDIKTIFDTVDIAFVRLEREYRLTGDRQIA